jgi:prophage tail gpP-like protein
VLDEVGTKAMASGFTVPGNVEHIVAEESVDQRFSDYLVVWTAINQLADLGVLSNHRAQTKDPFLGEYRPRIIVSEQLSPDFDVGVARANWELARRIGRSQTASITCDSWRDTGNKLWSPNWLAPIQAPDANIVNANWIIGTVTFRKDMSGTHADLVLMPPDAFKPEPNPLGLYDAQLAQSPKVSQDPAPPSTNPPTPGVH